MPQTGEGAWVRFRVHIVRAPGFAGGTFASPQAAGQTLLKVTGISPEVGGSDDSAARSGIDDEGREYVDSYVVRVEVGRAVPGDFFRDVLPALQDGLRDAVKASTVRVWAAVIEEISTSESPSFPGDPPGRDTGVLMESIRFVIDSDGLGASVGSPLDYALHLEFGTRYIAERPFLFPALEREKPSIDTRVRTVAQTVLRGRDPVETNATLRAELNLFRTVAAATGSPDAGSRPAVRLFLPDLIESLIQLSRPSRTSEDYYTGVR